MQQTLSMKVVLYEAPFLAYCCLCNDRQLVTLMQSTLPLKGHNGIMMHSLIVYVMTYLCVVSQL